MGKVMGTGPIPMANRDNVMHSLYPQSIVTQVGQPPHGLGGAGIGSELCLMHERCRMRTDTHKHKPHSA